MTKIAKFVSKGDARTLLTVSTTRLSDGLNFFFVQVCLARVMLLRRWDPNQHISHSSWPSDFIYSTACIIPLQQVELDHPRRVLAEREVPAVHNSKQVRLVSQSCFTVIESEVSLTLKTWAQFTTYLWKHLSVHDDSDLAKHLTGQQVRNALHLPQERVSVKYWKYKVVHFEASASFSKLGRIHPRLLLKKVLFG